MGFLVTRRRHHDTSHVWEVDRMLMGPSTMQVAGSDVLVLRHVDLYLFPPNRPIYPNLISQDGDGV